MKRNLHRTIYNTYGCCLMVAVAGMALGSAITRDATAADAVGLSVNISVGSSTTTTTTTRTRTRTARTARGGAVARSTLRATPPLPPAKTPATLKVAYSPSKAAVSPQATPSP